MARIIAPNKEYAGFSAGVLFEGGIGCTDDAHLIEWFKSHGYEVEEKAAKAEEKAETKTETKADKKAHKKGE